ncbi:MAG: hypothetical protein MJZ11_08500 [Lachnospiraceae bacterium]|nr:hypothetical protein [Lachnospiraceae bacterium]
MGNMVFHKENRPNGFTTISNTILRDKTISARSKGLFCYLMSLPPDWELHISTLSSNFTEGRDAINNALKELTEHKYLEKFTEVNGNLKGRVHFTIHEEPQLTENGSTDSRLTENPPLLNTYNTKDLNTKYLNSKSHCDETSDTTSSVNDSSSVAIAPSSESLRNEEKVSDDTENTPSLTSSEDSLSHTSNTFSEADITQTPKEKESVPAKEKEKVLAKDVIAHYAMRWEQMRGCGRLTSECPKQSFAIIQRLINSSGLSLEEIKKVIDLGFKSTEYILIKNKYPLRTMLGSWWVPIALNGPVEEPKRYNNKKYTPASPDQLNANESYEKGAWK